MVHCELPNTPTAPSTACSSLLVLNFDGILVLSARTQTPSLIVAVPPVLQLQERTRSESSSKEFRSNTYLPRVKEQAVSANLYCSVQSQLQYLSARLVWKSEQADRLDGCTWCLLSCANLLGSKETQRRTKLSAIATDLVRDQASCLRTDLWLRNVGLAWMHCQADQSHRDFLANG